MKSLIKLVFALLMTSVMLLISAFAQNQKPSGARGIDVDYDGGRVDAIRVSIKKLQNDELVPVLSTTEFKTGDRIKVEFESNFDGFVYILNVGPNGRTCLLFPHPNERDNKLQARQRHPLPPDPYFLKFNEEKGDEILQVYMSRQPIPLFDDALKSAIDQGTKPCLGESAASAAKELAGDKPRSQSKPQGGTETRVNSPILAQGGRSSARGIRYDSGEDSTSKETTIAVDPKNGDAHLKSGETAFCEIRLKHK